MTQWGSVHCLSASKGTIDERLGAVYYDQTRVFEQIRAYTGNPVQWDPCIASAVATYRGYVESSVAWGGDGYGAVQGYWNFSGGLRKHYERTGDEKSKAAVLQLAKNAAYCADWTPPDYITNPARSREVAYCIEAKLNAQALGQGRTAYSDLVVSAALSHIDQWFISKTYRLPADDNDVPVARGQYYLQPFMVGLTTHALMREWERSRDTRILPAVKVALDGIWSRAWVSTDRAFWYENWVSDPSLTFPSKAGAPDLNLLIAPAFAMYARAAGDDSYRQKADQIFDGGVAGAYLQGCKQFNQNYMWSFDYVKYRGQ